MADRNRYNRRNRYQDQNPRDDRNWRDQEEQFSSTAGAASLTTRKAMATR